MNDKPKLYDLHKSTCWQTKADTGIALHRTFNDVADHILTSGTDTVDIHQQIVTALRVERDRCAKIADIFARTKPIKGSAAPLIATVTSETGKAIGDMIRNGTPAPAIVPEVKIEVSGGVVSGVSSTGPVQVLVYDYDHIEGNEDDCEAAIHSFGEGGKAL